MPLYGQHSETGHMSCRTTAVRTSRDAPRRADSDGASRTLLLYGSLMVLRDGWATSAALLLYGRFMAF